MPYLRRTLVAFVALFAFSAVLANVASAAEPEFSPVPAKPKFTISSAAGKLANLNGETIECKKDKGKGEITGAKTISAEVDFEECIALFFTANSLGDSPGTILTKLTGELCFINKATLEVGVYLTPEPVHIEVPSAGALVAVAGTIVGKITPDGAKTKEFKLELAENGTGDPKWASCTGSDGKVKTGTQTSAKNEGTPVMSAMKSSETMVGEEETTITG